MKKTISKIKNKKNINKKGQEAGPAISKIYWLIAAIVILAIAIYLLTSASDNNFFRTLFGR